MTFNLSRSRAKYWAYGIPWICGCLVLVVTCRAQEALAVQVVGRTATQAVLSYTASGACTVEVSESPSYTPLVHDVDPALFAGSNLDTRPEALSSGASHVFVVGKRLIEKGSDGRNYSRALQTNTTHYYRITCGAGVGSGSFTTANIPFGMTYSDGLQADPGNPGGYVYPTVVQDRSQSVIDPQTGVLIKPLTQPSDVTVKPNTPNWSSAGFHEFCSPLLSSNGYYHCIVPNDWAPMLYGINPTTGDARFLGTLYYFGQTYDTGTTGVHGCYNGASAMWDDTNANIIYCGSNTSSGDLVAVQLTYTGNDQPVTSGQTSGYPPQAPLIVRNLTPSPNTLGAQLLAFAPTLVGNCGIDAYQAGYLAISCRRGQQDTYAWIGAYDLGNKLPIGQGGTGSVKALIKMWEQPASRWCGQHTYEYLGNVPVLSYATQTLKGGSTLVGHGPYQVTLTSSMPSANMGDRTTVTVSSFWDSSWGTAPSGFQSGEPVSPVDDHFLMQAQVGDYFTVDGEFMMLVQKLSSWQWVLQRGVGSNYPPKPHSNGASLQAYCNAGGADPGTLPYMWWDFLTSPDASNAAAYRANFGSHPVARGSYRINPDWSYRMGNIADPSTWGMSNITGGINSAPKFAGALMPANGNYFQKHTSMPFSAPAWFLDVLPFVGGNLATVANDSSTTPLGGNLYQYHYNGLDTDGLSRKQVATFAFGGASIMIDISGPNSVIDGSSTYTYKYCVANKTNECVSGSHAGDIFFNVPTLTVGSRFCTGGEVSTGAQDVCIGDVPTVGFSVAQFKVANDTTGQSIRVLSKMFAYAHGSSTSNTKPLPDGSWTLYRSYAPAPAGVYAIKIPPLPAPDGVNRTTFVRTPLNLIPPAGKGIVSAKVYFGYSEQGDASQYYCTSRREACVAVSPTISDSNPFSYAQSDTYTPAPCAASCTITIPVLPMHTAYFRVSYLDSAGNEVAADQGVASEQAVSATGSASAAVSVSVSPASVSLSASQTVQFVATVTGLAYPSVTWSLSPSVGSISNGLYTAPSVINASQTVTIRATSIADPTRSASATVALTPTSAPISINITSPTSQPTFTTSQNTVSLAGTASINTTQIIWATDQGSHGQATGTMTWTASGIGLRSGSNHITVTASDAAGNQSSAIITIIFSPLAITTTSLPVAQIRKPYSYSLTAEGGTAPLTWSVTPAPDGFAVSGDGLITGTPAKTGTFMLDITVRDSMQMSATATVSLQIADGFVLVSAASLTSGPVAPESWVAAFGTQLADAIASQTTSPVPTKLGDSTIIVRDANGLERAAGMNYVSPTHINFTIPAGTAVGSATVTIYSGDQVRAVGSLDILNTAPAVFVLNQDLLGNAQVLRVQGDSYAYESIVHLDPATNQFVGVPIDLGPDTDQVYLTLYGTGLRFRPSLDSVSVTIAGMSVPVLYAGDALYYDAVDIVNVFLPKELRGQGRADIVLTVNGQKADLVRVQIQ